MIFATKYRLTNVTPVPAALTQNQVLFVLRQGWCLLCNMYQVFKRKPFESGPHKRDLNTQK